MNKKILLIVTVILALFLSLFFILSRQDTKKTLSPVSPNQVKGTNETTDVDLAKYGDPSGFSFMYPKSLQLSVKETKDKAVYSSISLEDLKKTGSIVIEVKDSDIQSAENWLEQNKISYKTADLKKVKLGDIEGKELKMKDSIVIIALDNAVLFLIQTTYTANAEFWNTAANTISSSFIFIQPTSIPQTNSDNEEGGDGSVLFEGEEILE